MIGWEELLRNDLFSVEYGTLNPNSISLFCCDFYWLFETAQRACNVYVTCFRFIWLVWFLWLFVQIHQNMSTSALTMRQWISWTGLWTRNRGDLPSSLIWRGGRSSWCCACGSASWRTTKTGLHHQWRTWLNRRQQRTGNYGLKTWVSTCLMQVATSRLLVIIFIHQIHGRKHTRNNN